MTRITGFLLMFGALNGASGKSLRGQEGIMTQEIEVYSDRDTFYRELSGVESCRKSTLMRVQLLPITMKEEGEDEFKKIGLGTKIKKTRNISANIARLTFCLDRIYLDLKYILNSGTVITDLAISCPHLDNPVSFFGNDFALPVETTDSVMFGFGQFSGEADVESTDILRILAGGNACEFSVKADGFEGGFLFGNLDNDGFVHVSE